MAQRVLAVFGTRPEAIKLAPVILHLRSRPDDFDVSVCVTAQHRQMLDQVLGLFEISPDIDLNLMRPNQDLPDLTANLIQSLGPVMREERPDWVLVQGDTTTVWTAALAAFYQNIPVGHVEAGLRTYDKRQPFPEEINRRLCTQLSDLHFAPTQRSRENLLAEGVPADRIVVTGNTVIDALHWVLKRIRHAPPPEVTAYEQWVAAHVGERPLVLITGHRRESFGSGFENICGAISALAREFSDVHWVYPVHLNPHVREPVHRILGGRTNIHLLEPLEYAPFCWLMQRSELILTDSGGVQEEAPSLGKFVMVMRNTTERPEGIEAGCVKLVGNQREQIVQAVTEFLRGGRRTIVASSPYGDGLAAARIAQALLDRRR